VRTGVSDEHNRFNYQGEKISQLRKTLKSLNPLPLAIRFAGEDGSYARV
jgi:hypothetical protein